MQPRDLRSAGAEFEERGRELARQALAMTRLEEEEGPPHARLSARSRPAR